MQDAELSDLIQRAIAIKQGDKEFALFYYPPEWVAEIGNPSDYSSLGDVAGEFSATGDTPEQALSRLIALLTPPLTG